MSDRTLASITEAQGSHQGNAAVNSPRPAITADSAILILSFTAAAYAIAFTYERAYVTAFGLPAHLVEIDLKSILLAGAGIMSVVVVLNILSTLLTLIPNSWPAQIRYRFTQGLSRPTLLAILSALMGPHHKIWVNVFTWCSVAALLVMSFLIARRDMRKYQKEGNEYLRRLDVVESANPGAVWRWAESQIGFEGMRALFLFALALWVANLVGAAHARQQQNFLVSNATPPCIVIREYRGTLLCAVLDKPLQTLTGDYILIPTSLLERSFTLKLAGPFESADSLPRPR